MSEEAPPNQVPATSSQRSRSADAPIKEISRTSLAAVEDLLLHTAEKRTFRWIHDGDLFRYEDWQDHRKTSTACSATATVVALGVYVLLVRATAVKFIDGEHNTLRTYRARGPDDKHAPTKLGVRMLRDHATVMNESYYHAEASARAYPCCDDSGAVLFSQRTKEPFPAEQRCDSKGRATPLGDGTCFLPSTIPNFVLRGEYGTSPEYAFLEIAVVQCDPNRGARSPPGTPCATDAEYKEFWSSDVELELCLYDTMSSTGNDDSQSWRCPVFFPIPSIDWMLRAEVYFQNVLVTKNSRWDIFSFGWGQEKTSYVRFVDATPKLKFAGVPRNMDTAKFFVRLGDVVLLETLSQITLLDVVNSAGASWIAVMLLFSLLFRYLVNKYWAGRQVKMRAEQHLDADASAIVERGGTQDAATELRRREQLRGPARIRELEMDVLMLQKRAVEYV